VLLSVFVVVALVMWAVGFTTFTTAEEEGAEQEEEEEVGGRACRPTEGLLSGETGVPTTSATLSLSLSLGSNCLEPPPPPPPLLLLLLLTPPSIPPPTKL
jgi:hypothetical protein